jgi:Fic-DOC domain mobile mystery protein B
VTDLFHDPPNSTPLDPSLRKDLVPTWVRTRADLNEAEQANILKGAAWARRRKKATVLDLLREDYVKQLHREMFGSVWNWAGTYRQGELNIGVLSHLVTVEMATLLDNVRYWIEHKTYPNDEIAVRFHHGLTHIHAFPNGNGRHAREMADLLIERLGGEAFSWGGATLQAAGTLRDQYILALKAADDHNFEPLKAFVRS